MKIAVITNGPHFTLGGVENYSALFYEYFGNKYHIVEFPTLNIKKNNVANSCSHPNVEIDYSLLGWKPHLFVWGGSYTRKNYKRIFANFDLIIMNTMFLPVKWIAHPKVVVVQHMNKNWYTLGGKNKIIGFGQLINRLFFNVSTITNAFKNVNHAVFFTQETATASKGKKFYITLAHKNKEEIKLVNNPRQGFVWISRLDNQQKNVHSIVELANLNDDINIYGHGHSKKIIDKYLINKSQYLGYADKNNIDEILKKTKALLMTSNFEGFPFTAMEALSNGALVVVFNTFDAIKFLEKSGAIFLIKKGDIKSFNNKIAWIRNLSAKEYSKISQKAIEFAQENFSKESFWTKWDEVIDYFKQKNN